MSESDITRRSPQYQIWYLDRIIDIWLKCHSLVGFGSTIPFPGPAANSKHLQIQMFKIPFTPHKIISSAMRETLEIARPGSEWQIHLGDCQVKDWAPPPHIYHITAKLSQTCIIQFEKKFVFMFWLFVSTVHSSKGKPHILVAHCPCWKYQHFGLAKSHWKWVTKIGTCIHIPGMIWLNLEMGLSVSLWIHDPECPLEFCFCLSFFAIFVWSLVF